MKPESSNISGSETPRKRAPMSGGHLPIEWMDRMSWRLPSGQALAEFALQAGFLAPLILSPARRVKRVAKAAEPASASGLAAKSALSVAELPETR